MNEFGKFVVKYSSNDIEIIKKIWTTGLTKGSRNINLFRTDKFGKKIKFSDFGKRTKYGWFISYIPNDKNEISYESLFTSPINVNSLKQLYTFSKLFYVKK